MDLAMDDQVAPAVRWEACEAFRPNGDETPVSCSACGWLVDDHADEMAAVTALLTGPAPFVERRAS